MDKSRRDRRGWRFRTAENLCRVVSELRLDPRGRYTLPADVLQAHDEWLDATTAKELPAEPLARRAGFR